MREFVKEWTSQHLDLAFSSGQNHLGQLTGNDAVGAVTILHERTRRVDPLGVGVPVKTIHNVLAGRYRHTQLRIADALLAAAHLPEALRDGRVNIVPNPNASSVERASCCGGSLTGSPGLPKA